MLTSIFTEIQHLGCQNDVLRATIHIDENANDISQSYMAIHDASESFQNIEIISDDGKLQQALRKPFDLSKEFPVKWIVHQQLSYVTGGVNTSYTIYAMGHHIAVDGSSMSQLSYELLNFSEDKLSAAQSASSASYGDFVHWQKAYLRSAAAKEAQKFWLTQISGTAPYEWWHAKATGAETQDYRQMNTWGFFSNEELAAWSKMYGTSWFRIATSVIGLLVTGHSKPSPHHDHILQVAFGARQSKFSACISHMANTMPIRTPITDVLTSGGSFADLVKNVGKRISQAKKHEMFPFMSLIEAAREKKESNHSDKVVVTFSPKLADKRCTLYPVQGVWDLFFCFLEQDDGVSLGVISDPAIFDSATLENLRQDFMSTVQLSQESSQFELDSLSYLSGAKTANIANGPPTTDADTISSSLVIDWIHERCKVQPESIALQNGEQEISVTYSELDSESSKRALCE